MPRENNSGAEKKPNENRTVDTRSGYTGRSLKRKISRMGRRELLSTLSTLGLGTTALNSLSTEALADSAANPKDEVPYVAAFRVKDKSTLNKNVRSEMKPVVESMSRDRWVRMEAAHNASERLYRQLQQKFNDSSISVGVRTRNNRKELIVTRQFLDSVKKNDLPTTAREIKESLPTSIEGTVGDGKKKESITGIPVSFENVRLKKYGGDIYNDRYDPIPGGCFIQLWNSIKGDHDGTAAQPVWSNWKNDYVMLTAGHLCHDDEGYTYKYGYQWSTVGDPFGTAKDWDNTVYGPYKDDIDGNGTTDEYSPSDIDAGYYSLGEDGRSHKYALAGIGGTYQEDISGYLTWTKIKAEEGTDWTIKKQGSVTGRTSGNIEYTDGNKKWFATSASARPGDSGSPFFNEESSSDVNTAGVLSTGVDFGNTGTWDGCGGNSLDYIMESLDLWFG